MLHIKELRSGLNIFKALGSEIRLEIIELLNEHGGLNLNDIAQHLGLTNGAVTMHIKKLQESGLIDITTAYGKHGLQKICYLNEKKLLIDLENKDRTNVYEVEIRVGHYSGYEAKPTCGLATKDSIIGEFDDPRYFADPLRLEAEMVWLTYGYLEYRIPNYLKANQTFSELQFIMEIASEAPSFNENWPSDIHFYLNDHHLGIWTSPGDFGNTRGLFNPDWWPPHLNQHGLLKLLRINKEGSFIDGCRISDTTIDDIGLTYQSDIKFKLEVPEDSPNSRGLTLFGKSFGNYNQDILVRVLSETNEAAASKDESKEAVTR